MPVTTLETAQIEAKLERIHTQCMGALDVAPAPERFEEILQERIYETQRNFIREEFRHLQPGDLGNILAAVRKRYGKKKGKSNEQATARTGVGAPGSTSKPPRLG